MLILAGSFYLISTAAFSLLAIVVGFRLISLSQETGAKPERWLGISLMLTAGFGYGILIAATLGRQAAGWDDAPAFYTWLLALGWLLHNIGVMFMIDFVRRVFRPSDRWARALEATLVAVLWIGWLGDASTGGLTSLTHGFLYWVSFSVIGTYPLWTVFESLRYWAMMRRRVTLGLADPLVANRFFLWSIASICTLASIWTVQAPDLLGYDRLSPETAPVTAISLICTSIFGMMTICTYWLTFFPPAWYRRRFETPNRSVGDMMPMETGATSSNQSASEVAP